MTARGKPCFRQRVVRLISRICAPLIAITACTRGPPGLVDIPAPDWCVDEGDRPADLSTWVTDMPAPEWSGTDEGSRTAVLTASVDLSAVTTTDSRGGRTFRWEIDVLRDPRALTLLISTPGWVAKDASGGSILLADRKNRSCGHTRARGLLVDRDGKLIPVAGRPIDGGVAIEVPENLLNWVAPKCLRAPISIEWVVEAPTPCSSSTDDPPRSTPICEPFSVQNTLLRDALGQDWRAHAALPQLIMQSRETLFAFKACFAEFEGYPRQKFTEIVMPALDLAERHRFIREQFSEVIEQEALGSRWAKWLLEVDDPLTLPTDEGRLETLLMFREGNYWPFLAAAAKRMHALAPVKALGRFDEILEAADPGRRAIGLLARAAVGRPPNADTIKRLAQSSSDILDEALRQFVNTSRRSDVPLLLELLRHGRDGVAESANYRLMAHAHMLWTRYRRDIENRDPSEGEKPIDGEKPAWPAIAAAWTSWWVAHAALSDRQLAAAKREDCLQIFRNDPKKGLSYVHDIPLPSRDLRTLGKLALTLEGEPRRLAVQSLHTRSRAGDALALELLRVACDSVEPWVCYECSRPFWGFIESRRPLRPQLVSFIRERIEATGSNPQCREHWLDALPRKRASMTASVLANEALHPGNPRAGASLDALERAPDATKAVPIALQATRSQDERIRYKAYELLRRLIGPTNVVNLERPLREIWHTDVVAASKTSEVLLTIMMRYPSERLRSVFADAIQRPSPLEQYCGRVGLFLLGETEHLPAVLNPPKIGGTSDCRPTDESIARAGQARAVIDLLQRATSEKELDKLNWLIRGPSALAAVIDEWRRANPNERTQLTRSLTRLVAGTRLPDRQLTREELEAAKIAVESAAENEPEVVPGRPTWMLVRLHEPRASVVEKGWVVERGKPAQAVSIILARRGDNRGQQKQSPEKIVDKHGSTIIPGSPRRNLQVDVRTHGAFTSSVAGGARCLFEHRDVGMNLVACEYEPCDYGLSVFCL